MRKIKKNSLKSTIHGFTGLFFGENVKIYSENERDNYDNSSENEISDDSFSEKHYNPLPKNIDTYKSISFDDNFFEERKINLKNKISNNNNPKFYNDTPKSKKIPRFSVHHFKECGSKLKKRHNSNQTIKSILTRKSTSSKKKYSFVGLKGFIIYVTL